METKEISEKLIDIMDKYIQDAFKYGALRWELGKDIDKSEKRAILERYAKLIARKHSRDQIRIDDLLHALELHARKLWPCPKDVSCFGKGDD